MPFVIRSQGFFYTDEYYAPGGAWARVVREVFDTRDAAEKVRREMDRARMKVIRPSDLFFDDPEAIERITKLICERCGDVDAGDRDWFYEAETWPEELSDADLDAILEGGGVVLSQVVEVDDPDEPMDDEVEPDEFGGDLWFGEEPETFHVEG